MLSTFVTDRRMSKCSRKWAWMPIGSPSPGREYCLVSTKLIQYVLYDEKVNKDVMLHDQSMLDYCCGANFDTCLMFSEGTLEGGINYKGIKYYKNLINKLKENGENII